MPGHVDLGGRAVDREAVRRHAVRSEGRRGGARREPGDIGPAGEARQDALRAGRQLRDPDPGRIGDGGHDRRRPDVHRQLPDPLGAVGRGVERRLDEDRRDARRIERGRDDVRRESIVEVAAVAQLDLLDRGVADGLQRAALDLALGEDRVDDPADVVGGDDVADMDLAGVEIDLDVGDAGGPAERRVGIAAVQVVVEGDAVRDTARTAGRCGSRRARARRRRPVSANEPPVAASTCSRSRRAALISRPPTTIAVRDATVGPLSGT